MLRLIVVEITFIVKTISVVITCKKKKTRHTNLLPCEKFISG